MRHLLSTLSMLAVLPACGGGPTHWKDQPTETVAGTFKGHAYTIDLPKGMRKSDHTTYEDEYSYHQDKGGEDYVFAPNVGVGWSDKKSTLDEAVKREQGAIVHKDQQADGWVFAFENDSKKGNDYVIHAERYVGDAAWSCHARVYPMKKGEEVKDLIPLVEKMCLSIKAK